MNLWRVLNLLKRFSQILERALRTGRLIINIGEDPFMHKLVEIALKTLQAYITEKEIEWKLDVFRSQIQQELNHKTQAGLLYYWDFIDRRVREVNRRYETEDAIINKLWQEIKTRSQGGRQR